MKPLMEFIIRLIVNYEDKYVPELTELFPELAEEAPVEAPSENSNPPPYASELSDGELAAHGFFSIGCLLWEGGKTEKALSAYDTAVRLQPNYAEVYNNRGNIKSRLDSRDAALDDYGEAIRLNPNFAEAYSNRGSTKFRLGKHAAALADLNAAIRLQPNFMNTYANRGVAQLGLGNIDAAKSDFQVALELVEQQENDNLKTFVEEQLQQLNQAASKQNNKKPRRGGQWKGKVKIAEDFDELPEPFMESFRREDE
ncbi:MAG: tetratricopeptide repeat protein [Candidatus Poribacteria bacterium]|nr:tetratricopeptide repeat protein [Candidatus Poribacteria bacterium]